MMNPTDPTGINTLWQNAAMSPEYIKQAQKLYGTGRSADMQAAINYPDSPTLKFDTNATGIGTGIVQGLGNAVNNYQQLKNYRTRTEMLGNAVLEQRQREQQQVDMLARQEEAQQAEAERQYQGGLQILEGDERTKPLVPYYQSASPEERVKILGEARGFYTDPTKTKLTKGAESEAEIQAAQAKLNWQRERFHAATGGVYPEDVFTLSNQQQLQPNIINAWKYIYDAEPPKDLLDYNQRFNVASVDSIKAQAQPTLTAQEIEQNNLTMQGKQIDNFIGRISASFAPERMKEQVMGMQLDNTAKAEKIERINKAMDIFAAYQDRRDNGELTAADVARAQSEIGMLVGLTPQLDETLRQVLGLKPGVAISNDSLNKLFSPPAQPNPVVQKLSNANTKIQGKVDMLAGKKKEAEGKAAAMDKTIKTKQNISAGYDQLEKDAKEQLKKVDALLKKYGG